MFALAWLGIWLAQLTPIQLLLPTQVDLQLQPTQWVDSVVAFGIISGIAGVCALIAYPVTGMLSDRTATRFGRRRPWMVVGTMVFAGALILLGAQHSMIGIGIFWCLALTGFCVLTAALTAIISDQVPVRQRGLVSGWMSAPQAIGIIVGLVLVTALALGQFAGYLLTAVLLVVLVLPFVCLVPEPPAPSTAHRKPALADFWISPRAHPDFGWTLLSRVLVNIGNAFGTTLLLYFLQFGLGDTSAADDLVVLSAIYMVFVLISAVSFGKLSDVIGRRKVFVFTAASLQGIAALLLAFVPSLPVAMVAAGFLGFGFGSFLSVDQALATQVLPNAADRGKDLGIMNIAYAVPQAIAPLAGAGIVALTGGFTVLFLVAGFTALLGALAVVPVKAVR
nr:MFS transporter [Spelaeicoccus albus]